MIFNNPNDIITKRKHNHIQNHSFLSLNKLRTPINTTKHGSYNTTSPSTISFKLTDSIHPPESRTHTNPPKDRGP